MFRTCVVIALVVLGPALAHASRLPLLAVPEHYRLHFIPDLATERFEGTAVIRVRVLAPTRHLMLHAAELDILRATVSADRVEHAAVVSLDAKNETLTLSLPVELKVAVAEIRLRYTGTLNRQLRGFYISEANGRKYAVTQLEATDARRMFPSFDEPSYKATFDVSVVVARGDHAISNGPAESVVPGPKAGTKTIDFATTAKMSTYLVALAVGDFECVRTKVATTPLGVCATPDKRHLIDFSMDAARATLEWFNGYFAIDYPFGKLDLVAIPDFAAGAMENTGAVFFRESLLLVDRNAAVTWWSGRHRRASPRTQPSRFRRTTLRYEAPHPPSPPEEMKATPVPPRVTVRCVPLAAPSPHGAACTGGKRPRWHPFPCHVRARTERLAVAW